MLQNNFNYDFYQKLQKKSISFFSKKLIRILENFF